MLGALIFPGGASAHGEAHLYQSVIRGIEPAGPASGVTARIIDFDSQIELANHSGKTVTVEGYEGEPYARIEPDGAVLLNAHSPSMAPSNDRLGRTPPTGDEDADAPPNWIQVADDGRFAWFDRRIQYRRKGLPEVVNDEAVRTRVRSWSIPITVGHQSVAVKGDLYWLGRRPFPTGVFLAILLLTAAGGLFGAWAIRRMREEDGETGPPT